MKINMQEVAKSIKAREGFKVEECGTMTDFEENEHGGRDIKVVLHFTEKPEVKKIDMSKIVGTRIICLFFDPDDKANCMLGTLKSINERGFVSHENTQWEGCHIFSDHAIVVSVNSGPDLPDGLELMVWGRVGVSDFYHHSISSQALKSTRGCYYVCAQVVGLSEGYEY